MLAAELGAQKAKKPQPDKKKEAAVHTEGDDGPWCSIHYTTKHDLKECRQVQTLAEERRKA